MRAWRINSTQVSIPSEGIVELSTGTRLVEWNCLTQLVHEHFILDLESWVERCVIFSIGSFSEHVLA